MESTALNGRKARLQILLSEFDIVYVSQKAIKGSAIADFLASRALEDYEPLNFDFPNEDLMYVANTEENPQIDHIWKLNFDGASNAIEYEACIMGIREAIERKIKVLKVYGDFALVIYQLKGEWETRDPKLINYKELVLELVDKFDDITFCYLPRDENQMADTLATLALMIKVNKLEIMKPIQMSIYEVLAHCYSIKEEGKDDHPWYQSILQYVKNRKYPDQVTENDKRTLRRIAIAHVLDGEVLYKREKDQVLLRCVDVIEARKILEEVHEGICGTHANGFTMARQIMRFGYYWSTMEGDYISHAKKCHKCQIYGDKIHVPPSPLHVMIASWPFSMWGMDVIGLISPKTSNGHRFIFVFKISHHNSSPYRPKMNGAVEVANKNMKRIVGKMTETYKDWHEKLSFALLAYRTSVKTSIRATPFSLVYGIEVVLPIEVEIPSLRVLAELKLDEAEWVQSRYDQLNLIEDKRLKAIQHGHLYQKRMIRAYNYKVHPREFHEGDLVRRSLAGGTETNVAWRHCMRGEWLGMRGRWPRWLRRWRKP
ncbi:uncharacterized protein LOC105786822 [Gossypium raimondii]|uniref:uncharacterized protein LOC105786822 n=1 Tax=Gossypium raimondii TaxID=29730 RepID=UPI00063AC809|nr:uncharacterized protein LOC105786822 [Gossypium raimondii]